MARWFGVVGLAYVGWCGFLAVVKETMIFPMPDGARAEGRAVPEGWESWWLEGEDGVRTEAWWRSAAGGGEAVGKGGGEAVEVAGRAGLAVLYFHGNGELIDDNVEVGDFWAEWGVSVLLVEYPGYGRSGGSPEVGEIRRRAEQWYDRVMARPEVEAVWVQGYSLGGAFAAQVAVTRPVGGMVLESTFVSLPAMAREMGVWLYFSRERLDTRAVLRGMAEGVPVVITHGAGDATIRVEHGRRLAEARPGAVYLEGDYAHYAPGAQAGLRAVLTEWLGRGAEVGEAGK